jgi:hypothetical protein
MAMPGSYAVERSLIIPHPAGYKKTGRKKKDERLAIGPFFAIMLAAWNNGSFIGKGKR